jgi:phosphotransferase system enzyme I (PtsI)
MTLALHGIGVSRGYAIGRVHVLHRGEPEIVEYAIPLAFIDDEIERFQGAVKLARAQLREIREQIPSSVSQDILEFIDTHLLMMDDSALTAAPVKLIKERQCNAEWALKAQRDRLVQVFDQMDDPYLRTRRDDVNHVANRILRVLVSNGQEAGAEREDHKWEGRVVVADDLTPADTVLMQHQGVAAFVTEFGGPLSHTAILARNLGIPAIIGARSARLYLSDDETVIVDGEQGVLLSASEATILSHYRQRQREQRRERARLNKLRSADAITRDGVRAELQANIELPEDVKQVIPAGGTGVGLYRTEYLFMNRVDTPDEDEHYASYETIIGALGGQPVTIRTLDLGADKQVDGGRAGGPVATNPALGLRAIRLCLKELDIFRPQLRAILRASALGPVRMMIPMLSSINELRQVLRLVGETKQELVAANLEFDQNMPLGAMVEVPAAALSASMFARYLDFLSIGTNDLIQYTLAIDRIDDEVNYLYDPLHPAVLRLIHETISAGRRHKIPVSMCGEMAGDPRYTRLLLGLGLAQFSMHPSAIPEIKQIVRASNLEELEGISRQILRCTDPDKLPSLVAQITH